MKVIKKANSIEKILGIQDIPCGQPLRLCYYTITVPQENNILLYHTMTKELVMLEGCETNILSGCFSTESFATGKFVPEKLSSGSPLPEIDFPEQSLPVTSVSDDTFKYLCDHWFLVPVEHDDRQLALEIRDLAALMNPKDSITSYTIVTTMDCNARCFYCYEHGCEKESMSRQTAFDTAAFIQKSCGGKKVNLHWFGGEPLYNSEVIDVITDELAQAKIPFSSRMTSNAYLFDTKLVGKAVKGWNLKSVQVTLDGTEAVYNRRKAYINNAGSAFVRVIDNIEMLLEAGVGVLVRLNMDLDNVNDLMLLCDFLADRFGNYENLSLSADHIFKGENLVPLRGEPEQVYSNLKKLKRHIRALNFKGMTLKEKKYADLNRITLCQCMADNDAAIVISPGGELRKCQHFYRSDICGTIYSGITNREAIESWKVTTEPDKNCGICPLYPNCKRLAACRDDRGCLDYRRDDMIHALKVSICAAAKRQNGD